MIDNILTEYSDVLQKLLHAKVTCKNLCTTRGLTYYTTLSCDILKLDKQCKMYTHSGLAFLFKL